MILILIYIKTWIWCVYKIVLSLQYEKLKHLEYPLLVKNKWPWTLQSEMMSKKPFIFTPFSPALLFSSFHFSVSLFFLFLVLFLLSNITQNIFLLTLTISLSTIFSLYILHICSFVPIHEINTRKNKGLCSGIVAVPSL